MPKNIRILFCLGLSVILQACASTATRPQVQIEGLETTPVLKPSKAKTFGTNLNTQRLGKVFVQKENEAILPLIQQETPEGDLAKLLELEIAFYRNPNNQDLLRQMMDYANSYQDATMAERAFEMALHLRSRKSALEAATLWIRLAPDSQKARSIYIRELILQSRYAEAFDFMAGQYDQGLGADFRLISTFVTPQNEEQMRSLISTYDYYLRNYPAIKKNLLEGQQIARYKLAELLFYNEQLATALQALNLILSDQKTVAAVHKSAINLKARIYYLTQQPGGEVFYDAEIKNNRNSLLLVIYYALYLINTQRHAQAEDLLSPFLTSNTAEEQVYLLALLAQDRSMSKLRRKSLDFYKTLAGRNDLGYIRLGLLAMHRTDYALAEEFLSRIQRDSNHWDLSKWLLLQIILDTKEVDKIEGTINDIYKKDRNLYIRTVGRYINELAKAQLGNEAKKVIQEAEEIVPLEKDLLLAKAYMYYELEEIAQMIKTFDQLLKLDAKDSSILNGYGYALADKSIQIKKAKNLIEAALKIEPGNVAYADSLGWAEYRHGDLERAQELLEWAHRQQADGEIAAHLGEVLWIQGEFERARYTWLKAYELDPHSLPLLNTLFRFNINPRRLNPNIHLFTPRY